MTHPMTLCPHTSGDGIQWWQNLLSTPVPQPGHIRYRICTYILKHLCRTSWRDCFTTAIFKPNECPSVDFVTKQGTRMPTTKNSKNNTFKSPPKLRRTVTQLDRCRVRLAVNLSFVFPDRPNKCFLVLSRAGTKVFTNPSPSPRARPWISRNAVQESVSYFPLPVVLLNQ